MNRSKLDIVYSVAVLVIVPALLAFNTILLTTNVRSDYDTELQSRAELSNSVLASALQQSIIDSDTESLDSAISRISATQNELKNIAVITKSTDGYQTISTVSEDYEISNSDALQYDIVYSRAWPVAKNTAATTDSGRSTRAWNVASPVIVNDQVVAVVTSDLLTADVDEKVDATLQRSVLIMIASAIAVMVLLFNHFRFIGYANLLRKQQELNQTMSDFLSVATHELKAPMSIIKGYISNVMDGDFGEVSPDVKKQLDVAVNQTDRLNSLVQDLLNVSRIEQGRIKFDIQEVDVSEIIRTITSQYKQAAADKGIELVYQQEAPVVMSVDAGRAQEIFTNLIDNAVKYSREGTIQIHHETKGSNIITSVRDNGIGMTHEERKRLFQRFYRVKNEHTQDIEGTGLGLWIIKQYIEKMGGSIAVDSLVGSGTEFRVTLKSAQK